MSQTDLLSQSDWNSLLVLLGQWHFPKMGWQTLPAAETWGPSGPTACLQSHTKGHMLAFLEHQWSMFWFLNCSDRLLADTLSARSLTFNPYP